MALNPSGKSVSASIAASGKKAKAVIVSGKASYKSSKDSDTVKMSGVSAAIFKLY